MGLEIEVGIGAGVEFEIRVEAEIGESGGPGYRGSGRGTWGSIS